MSKAKQKNVESQGLREKYSFKFHVSDFKWKTDKAHNTNNKTAFPKQIILEWPICMWENQPDNQFYFLKRGTWN